MLTVVTPESSGLVAEEVFGRVVLDVRGSGSGVEFVQRRTAAGAVSGCFVGRHVVRLSVFFHLDLLLNGFVELAGHLLKLFDAGKLVDVFEAEAEEEVLGGLVEDGAADDLLAAGGGDELARQERAEHAGGVDATNLGDLGGGDGLLVGDDGERLEGLQGELQRGLEALDEAADGIVVLGLGAQAEAAGDLADLEAAVAIGVVGDELFEDGAEVVAELALAGFGLAGGVARELLLVVGGGFRLLGGRCLGDWGLGGWGLGLRGRTLRVFGLGGRRLGFEDRDGVDGFRVEGFGVVDRLRLVGVRCRFVFESERLLLGGEGFELGLAFFARVDDGFDLGFKAHGCAG